MQQWVSVYKVFLYKNKTLIKIVKKKGITGLILRKITIHSTCRSSPMIMALFCFKMCTGYFLMKMLFSLGGQWSIGGINYNNQTKFSIVIGDALIEHLQDSVTEKSDGTVYGSWLCCGQFMSYIYCWVLMQLLQFSI